MSLDKSIPTIKPLGPTSQQPTVIQPLPKTSGQPIKLTPMSSSSKPSPVAGPVKIINPVNSVNPPTAQPSRASLLWRE